ncbi:helix-turn-helix transcriptional regulator [Aestuariibius insulae]|uniref:helix-turn-helix transcriptional regulator n=1 Tax=Aestuariibius insulae TaxID=2058287 RepID=UPI00345E1ABB
MKLRNNLRKIRLEQNITQQKLADAVGVSRKTINTIENSVFIPSTIISLKISRVLGSSVEDIFFLDE